MSIYFEVHDVTTWVIFSNRCALYLEEKFYWKTAFVAFCPLAFCPYTVHQ